MTLIDGDRIITAKLYDDEHEEFIEKKMSIIDCLNAYTDEGVTEADVVEQPRWIPVSEGLPEEENRLYWVCTDTGYQCQCRWTNDVYGLGASDRWGWKIFDIPQYQKVIAWMSLPKPYKAESEGI